MSDTALTFEVGTNSVEETLALGAALGRAFVGELQIGLIGSLGAGKTHLVKGMAQGNAKSESPSVTSPTFTLVHEYTGRMRLFHADLYRLQRPEELVALGYDEWLDANSVVVIEWADRFRDVLGDDVLWIELNSTGTNLRTFRFEACGEAAETCLNRLRAALR